MSLSAPARRLVPLRGHTITLPFRPTTRTFTTTAPKHDDSDPKKPNPVLDEYLRNNPTLTPEQQAARKRESDLAAAPTNRGGGDISASSIFEDSRRAQRQVEKQTAAATAKPATPTDTAEEDRRAAQQAARDYRNTRRVLDPDPDARERWERKKVIQSLRRGGRVTARQFVKRTERVHVLKSHNLKTSVKKLGMVARQIAGKGVEEAILQMRFSRKKVAVEVGGLLELARDEATVMRGMGLGGVSLQDDAGDVPALPAGAAGRTTVAAQEGKGDEPVQIQLKSGQRYTVADRSKIYIDQAWVGRGPYGKLPDYRARGQVNIMRTPWTSLSVVLKEEGTRVREWEEREAKRRRQRLGKVWTPLPDRPVQTTGQWYSW